VHLSRIGLQRGRQGAVLALLATVVALLVYPQQTAVAKPPPNPSDSQIQGAKNEKAALAAQVGKLSGQVAAMQQKLQQLEGEQELAEQKLANAISKLHAAQDAVTAARAAAKTAKANVAKARGHVVAAQQEFVAYVRASYMNGGVDGTTGTLLTADNPNVLLEQSAMRQYQSDHQISAIGNLQRATVAKSNADAAARRAVDRQQRAQQAQKQATTAAKIAEQNAAAAVESGRQQKTQLEHQQAETQTALESAQEHLATLNHQRAAYLAYQKRQAEIRAERARQERIRKERARKAYLARLARERAARHSSHSSSSGASFASSPAPAPSGGGWTAARGRAAVARAKNWLGEPYSWAGGNSSGPTYGVCDIGTDGWNDCNVRGFDCSGLTLYAWAPYTSLAHYTVTQWGEGSYHPSRSNLRPGDLVFWSNNGRRSGVHHVAIYEGHGMVIQAPFSGSYVQETPLDQVASGYYGATRPMT
jgi:cell wall-associated NlpC family hydrolase